MSLGLQVVQVDFFINIDMYTGADVSHPGPDIAKPSVTGLVFSYDEGATRYAALTERFNSLESKSLNRCRR